LGPQGKGVDDLETRKQLQASHSASSCAKWGGHMQACSNNRGTRSIKSLTCRRVC